MSHYRRSTSNGDLTFVFVILLASSLWAHKVLVTKIEHMLKLGFLVSAGAIFIVMLGKVFLRIKKYTKNHDLIIDCVDTMTGLEFERHVAKLLKTQGYSHITLTVEYDYGVDIIAVKNSITWGIQVKRYSGLVKAEAVRQVVTALRIYQCDRAMVITNSNFSHTATTLADSNDCVLIDRRILQTWIY
jgi:restriction system protein